MFFYCILIQVDTINEDALYNALFVNLPHGRDYAIESFKLIQEFLKLFSNICICIFKCSTETQGKVGKKPLSTEAQSKVEKKPLKTDKK